MSSGTKLGTSRTEGRPLNNCVILSPYLYFLRFTNFGRVTTTARDASYCVPVTVPSPNETTPSGTMSSTLIFLIQKKRKFRNKENRMYLSSALACITVIFSAFKEKCLFYVKSIRLTRWKIQPRRNTNRLPGVCLVCKM